MTEPELRLAINEGDVDVLLAEFLSLRRSIELLESQCSRLTESRQLNSGVLGIPGQEVWIFELLPYPQVASGRSQITRSTVDEKGKIIIGEGKGAVELQLDTHRPKFREVYGGNICLAWAFTERAEAQLLACQWAEKYTPSWPQGLPRPSVPSLKGLGPYPTSDGDER